ncbi:MAG TPA: hypothetical protein VMU84_04425 [Thermoanaerobaculia bacterium]|nr:hypothetical protein [Thermoanaerobaculia bacterium]
MLRKSFALLTLLVACSAISLHAQDHWTFKHRFELRANLRDSHEERLALRFPFPPNFIPPGQTQVFLATPDEGTHAELSVVNVQLDLEYGKWLGARAKVHFQDKYRRNPTSTDRQIDADELFIRVGEKPEFLERPAGTSFFALFGKAPKMERQPTRLLESYGLAATSFNRFEDVQVLVGGTVGRNFYWRAQAASGNPLFFRDPNALAGDNGTNDRRPGDVHPKLQSGFPILYNAETEGLFFSTNHVQLGEGLGYRWQRDDETMGFDVLLFHYKRELADEENLTGTFYGGDLDLLNGTFGISLPIKGDRKEEWGSRLYSEWRGATLIGQFTKQHLAGLQRQGWEAEGGYKFNVAFGPFESVQPAVRVSGLHNRFRGPANFVDPSVWWNWKKVDYGIRIGLAHNIDITVEHAKHSITAARKLDVSESLLTVRVRI